MKYTCPHCGTKIHNVNKKCRIDVTGVIAGIIESKMSIEDEFRLCERLKSTSGFYKKAGKGIISKRSIKISFSKDDIVNRLNELKGIRSYKKLDDLIEQIKNGYDDLSFMLQPQSTVHEGEKCIDTYVLLDENEGVKEKKAVRCCPSCKAPVSHFAGHFNSRTIILIRNSLWDKPSLLTTLKDACGDYTAGYECLIDDSDEMFSLGEFLLMKNNKHLLLSVIEMDERVFAAPDDELPEIDKKRLEPLLKNANYIWIPMNKEYGGFEFLKEDIVGRSGWLDKKRCIVRCQTNEENKLKDVKNNTVLKLYMESSKARNWLSTNDKTDKNDKTGKNETGRVLKKLEMRFKEKFYYFGSEKDDYKKALEWILFMEGIEVDGDVYIGKTRHLLKTIFSRDGMAEENLYINLTQQEGFMI